jgi:hypothetical protein
VDVVEQGPAQRGGVHTLVGGHRVVGETVDHPKLLVKEMADVRVKSVHQGEPMVFPGIVLKEINCPVMTWTFSIETISVNMKAGMQGLV